MVKLTRTLAIIPTVIVFALIMAHKKRREAVAAGKTEVVTKKVNIAGIVPWFILGFLVLTALNTAGLIPEAVSTMLKSISKFLMVTALAAIGLNTSFKDYINWLRLNYAQTMLLSTELPVTSVCFESGFSSLRTFDRAFALQFGVSPSRMRRQPFWYSSRAAIRPPS